jgi:hypothetical protein
VETTLSCQTCLKNWKLKMRKRSFRDCCDFQSSVKRMYRLLNFLWLTIINHY